MEDALIESSQQIEEPQIPVAPSASSYSHASTAYLGVLRIELLKVIPAGVLAEILSLLDDLYNAHTWLSLANSATLDNSTPDDDPPGGDQVMHISRMEIGTKNYIELFGRVDHLMALLGLLGSVIGLMTAAVNTLEIKFTFYRLSLNLQLKRLVILGKELDLKREQIINNPKQSGKSIYSQTEEIQIKDILPDFEGHAIAYAAQGLLSRKARNRLINFQEGLDERVRIFKDYVTGKPNLLILKEMDPDSTEPTQRGDAPSGPSN
jgi:hypothetical protein